MGVGHRLIIIATIVRIRIVFIICVVIVLESPATLKELLLHAGFPSVLRLCPIVVGRVVIATVLSEISLSAHEQPLCLSGLLHLAAPPLIFVICLAVLCGHLPYGR